MTPQLYAGKSRTIAIAGAAGGVGQHIAEALLSAGFQVVLLLRKANLDLLAELHPFVAPGSTLQAEVVDFHSRENLASVFKAHQVDTCISALVLYDEEWKVEECLLNASLDAGLRRFAPSNLAFPAEASKSIRGYRFKQLILELVKNAPISWTHFTPGLFINYFATNAPVKADGETPLGHLSPFKLILDVENCTGTIPGTGEQPIALTEIYDVARGVAAACALEAPWTPHTGRMAADILSCNEIAQLAEQVRGRKFDLKYLSLDELEKLSIPASGMTGYDKNAVLSTVVWEAMRMIGQGRVVDAVGYGGLAEACAAEGIPWKPVGVQEFLEKWWRGV